MTEEQVTKAFLKQLIARGWDIVCFDFPQSGTGRLLHPDIEFDSEGKKIPSINPDIVAFKEGVCLFFENKNRFYLKDFNKVNSLITNNHYVKSIKSLLGPREVTIFYYGIGIPAAAYSSNVKKNEHLTDFIFGIDSNLEIVCLYNPKIIIV